MVDALVVMGLVATVGLAGPAAADPPSHVPGGPCIEDQQQVRLSSLPSYEEIVHPRLDRGLEPGRGRGGEPASPRGRQLVYATVGDGPDVFWLQARIHGNELHSTEAALQVLKYLASSGSAEARAIRENLTVIVIPMYNPDGATANIRQSTTLQDRPEPRLGSCSASPSPGRGTPCGSRRGRGSRSTCTTWGRALSSRGQTS